MNESVYYENGDKMCWILGDFCDNPKGCMGCYHTETLEQYLEEAKKKGIK